jgi:hypothetical protein
MHGMHGAKMHDRGRVQGIYTRLALITQLQPDHTITRAIVFLPKKLHACFLVAMDQLVHSVNTLPCTLLFGSSHHFSCNAAYMVATAL